MVYLLEAHEFFCLPNYKQVSLIDENVVAHALRGHLIRSGAEVAYRYCRGSPKSATLSCQSPAVSPAPSVLEDVYGGNLREEWETEAIDGDAA